MEMVVNYKQCTPSNKDTGWSKFPKIQNYKQPKILGVRKNFEQANKQTKEEKQFSTVYLVTSFPEITLGTLADI